MKYSLVFLSLILVTCGCGNSSTIDVNKIKTDLLGNKIGRWQFKLPSEFLDIRINEQTKTDEVQEINTDMVLQSSSNPQKRLYLHAILVYKLIEGEWKYIDGEDEFSLNKYPLNALPDETKDEAANNYYTGLVTADMKSLKKYEKEKTYLRYEEAFRDISEKELEEKRAEAKANGSDKFTLNKEGKNKKNEYGFTAVYNVFYEGRMQEGRKTFWLYLNNGVWKVG